jgi:hypothetical protein
MRKHFSYFLFAFAALTVGCSDVDNQLLTPTLLQEETSVHPYRISQNEAISNLESIMNDMTATRSGIRRTIGNISAVVNPTTSTRSSALQADTLLYIFGFENNEGYAIMSADKRIPEFLAITEEGALSAEDFNMPQSTRSTVSDEINWIESEEELSSFIGVHIMNYAIDCIAMEGEPTVEEEQKTRGTNNPIYPPSSSKISPLLKTNWSQSLDFSVYHKLQKGYAPRAGCVAIALGQIMAYHKLGNNHYPHETNYWEPISSFHSHYNLSQTPNAYQGDAMKASQFLWEIGESVNMEWGVFEGDGSFAYNVDAASVMNNDGYYQATFISDVIADKREIKKRTMDMLEKRMPVLRTGYCWYNGQQVGHAWVVDGLWKFRFAGLVTRNACHNNWGWGGVHNGWYWIEVFDISDSSKNRLEGLYGDYVDESDSHYGIEFDNTLGMIYYKELIY